MRRRRGARAPLLSWAAPGLLAAALLAVASPAVASPLDWVAGDADLADGGVPDPADGLTAGLLPPDLGAAGPSFRYLLQNEIPLTFARGGRPAGALTTLDHRVDGSAQLGNGRLDYQARVADTSMDMDLVSGLLRLRWDEWGGRVAAWHPLGGPWRGGVGVDLRRHEMELIVDERAGVPGLSGDLPTTESLVWLGVGRDFGPWSTALAGGWRSRDTTLDASAFARDGSAGVASDGWQGSAALALRAGDAWRFRLGGTWRDDGGRNLLFLGANRHGSTRPAYEEWRLGFDANGDVAPRLGWWGSLFHRELRSSAAGRASAIPPPLGSLAGPQYGLQADGLWRQTGFASGLDWQPAERTRVGFALRLSRGRLYAAYTLTERNGPGGTPATLDDYLLDQNITLGAVSLTGEQQLGNVVIGARVSGGYAWIDDRLPPAPPGPPSPPGRSIAVGIGGVPVAFWIGAPW